MGHRDGSAADSLGDHYDLMTMKQVDEEVQKFAKSMMKLNLCPKVQGKERDWNFLSIWSKNRWEWTVTLLACMHYNVTTVGFYDAIGAE